MPFAFLLPIANMLGINVFRLVAYAACVVAVIVALGVVRQHYVNLGWNKHKAAVERQDNIAVDASKKVEERTNKCSDENGFWDVITQGCKLQDAAEEKK